MSEELINETLDENLSESVTEIISDELVYDEAIEDSSEELNANIILLTKEGREKYPRTIAEAIAVIYRAKFLSTILKEQDSLNSDFENRIGGIEKNLDVLLGNDNGSVIDTVNSAINDFANKMTENGFVDTFKELVDYVAEHGAEFSALVGSVESLGKSHNSLYEDFNELKKMTYKITQSNYPNILN